MPATIQRSIAFLLFYGVYYLSCRDISTDFVDTLIGLIAGCLALAEIAAFFARLEE